MKRTFFSLSLLFGFFGNSQISKTKVDLGTSLLNENCKTVSDSDSDINNAINSAQSSLNYFLNNFSKKDRKSKNHSLKVKFCYGSDFEHIWLANIEEENGKYYGIVNNTPYYIDDLNVGDEVEINLEDVSDWMYIDNGLLVGGHTIRAFRNKMTISEKKSFDAQLGFKI